VKILVAGGTGFLGRALVSHLSAKGHEIVVLSRHATPAASGNVRHMSWSPDGQIPSGVSADLNWPREIEGAGAVINLAGAGMADKRWTPARKRELKASRLFSTRSLVAAVRAATKRPDIFIQGSAVGYYGTGGDQVFDESFPPGLDVLGEMCVAWEAEAHGVTALGARLVVLRAGVVLGQGGGIVKQMARPFRFFVGGPVASGRQYLSWIHRDDWLAFVTWVLDTPSVSGVYNATSPEPVTNEEFSKALGHALGRPSWLRVPAFALRTLFGQMASEMLIRGQRVVPKRALQEGFQFTYPAVEGALRAAV
jgi:uncharacterized protein